MDKKKAIEQTIKEIENSKKGGFEPGTATAKKFNSYEEAIALAKTIRTPTTVERIYHHG